MLSDSDFAMFDNDIRQEDYDFYQRHRDAFRRMWVEQVRCLLLVTARIRWMGEDNVLTRVCLCLFMRGTYLPADRGGGGGTGKTGNLKVHFSRQGKHREFAKKILKTCFYTGNLPPTQGKF